MINKYIVRLSDEEREFCTEVIKSSRALHRRSGTHRFCSKMMPTAQGGRMRK
jgi:hypothetical protein